MSAFKRDVSIAVNPDTKRDMAWRQNGRDMVAAEVEQMLTRRGSQGLPDAMPKTVKAAAAWILRVLIDPPAEDEGIRRVPAFGGFRWQTPYRDRAIHLAHKFLNLPQADQESVMAYARSGIRWRGDDVALLALLVAERVKPNAHERGSAALARVASRAALSLEDRAQRGVHIAPPDAAEY